MYVKTIAIERLRCFRSAELDFRYPGDGRRDIWHTNVTVLLGDNGGGKTTVLRAIALAALSDAIEQSGFVPYELVRRDRIGSRQARTARVAAGLVLHGWDRALPSGGRLAEEFRTHIVIERLGDIERVRSLPPEDVAEEAEVKRRSQRSAPTLYQERSPAFFLLGYGAQRTLLSRDADGAASHRKRRLLRYQRVAGLFEDQVPLAPLTGWLEPLRRQHPKRFREVVATIHNVLPEEMRFRGRRLGDEFLFEYRGSPVPAGALSDGYRAFLGWVSDLLYHLTISCPTRLPLSELPGVVLVDEVDLHLHPSWQRHVIPTLSRVFPKLQFILTTHSPIVAGTVSSSNIYLLDSAKDGAARAQQLSQPIHGLNADQILLSSYFDLATTRAPGFMDELRSLSAAADGGDPEAAMKIMEKLTTGSEASPRQARKSPKLARTRR